MRYLVLMRYGLWQFHVVLALRREEHSISCTEILQPGGMTWWSNERFFLTTDSGAGQPDQRVALSDLKEPVVAFSIPGPRLLDDRLPPYARDEFEGATVQVNAHAVLEEPDRVALQLVLVPRGEEPVHRETVGDRCVEDGEPAMWIVLARHRDEPAEKLVAKRVVHWPPPLRARAVRP